MTLKTKNTPAVALKNGVKLSHGTLNKAVLILRAANHPVRKEIVSLLDEKSRLPVTDIYVKLRLEQSVVSQHLAVLRSADIVSTEREGKFVYYTLNKKRLGEITDFVDKLVS
jgi:DNA-binding transcriptional ArsR family regulator